jgi:hypothetical protein
MEMLFLNTALLRELVYPNPTLCIWATGSTKHITGRRFLILESALESAAFSETVFGSAKRQYRRPEESKTWNHC